MLPNIPQGTGQHLTIKNNSAKDTSSARGEVKDSVTCACIIHWSAPHSLRSLFLLLSTLTAVPV